MFNQFLADPEASAWSSKSTDFLFNLMHSRISLHVDECCMVDRNLPLTQASPFTFCVRSLSNEGERLWEFVHPESVKKDWEFEFDGEKKKCTLAPTWNVWSTSFTFSIRIVGFWFV